MRKTFLGALGFCWCRHKYFVKGTKKIDTSVGEQKVTIVYGYQPLAHSLIFSAFDISRPHQIISITH